MDVNMDVSDWDLGRKKYWQMPLLYLKGEPAPFKPLMQKAPKKCHTAECDGKYVVKTPT